MTRIDEHARRAAIQHTIGEAADQLVYSDDLTNYRDEHERACDLLEAAADIVADIRRNACRDLDTCLLRAAAELQAWMEARARDAA